MILWAGGIAAYLAALAAAIYLWDRCRCTLRSQYELDERATADVVRALAAEGQRRAIHPRAFGLRLRRPEAAAPQRPDGQRPDEHRRRAGAAV